MAGCSAYLALIATVAIGWIGRHQIHALGPQKLLIFADITINNSEFFCKAIIGHALAQQLRNAWVAVYSGDLSSTTAFQQHADGARATAQLQHLGLVHHMGKIAQEHGISREAKLLGILPNLIPTARHIITAQAAFFLTHCLLGMHPQFHPIPLG